MSSFELDKSNLKRVIIRKDGEIVYTFHRGIPSGFHEGIFDLVVAMYNLGRSDGLNSRHSE